MHKIAALGRVSIPAYRCPNDNTSKDNETSYVMIVGERTFGGKPNETVNFAKITHGTSNTIAVVEVTGLGINWEEPKDITVDELMGLLASHGAQGGLSSHPGGFNALFADSHVQFIDASMDRQTLRAMLLRDDAPAKAPKR